MIIVQLMGGLGNQLFQYAMGRSLSLRCNAVFKIDTSFFETYEWHEYSLAPFAIKAGIASKDECNTLKKKHGSLLNRLLQKTIHKGEVIINESTMLFDPAYRQIKDPAYLFGYWQCEKYFEEYTAELRREFEIKIPPSASNRFFLDKINRANAVSLHIRRGNYVSVAEFNKVLGTCSLEYYASAIQYIEQRIPDPVFYVFSDDIEWAKANLTSAHVFVFIDINDAKHDYEDLRLMQNCKHHIIANSTFSWWGAWLNPSEDKIVIAPEQWFADPVKNNTAAMIVPGSWIKL